MHFCRRPAFELRFLDYRAVEVREHGLSLASDLTDVARLADVVEPT
jgi:hypothetical protein